MKKVHWCDLARAQKLVIILACVTLAFYVIGSVLNTAVLVANGWKMPYKPYHWLHLESDPLYIPMTNETRLNILGDWIVIPHSPNFDGSLTYIVSIGDILITAGYVFGFAAVPSLLWNIWKLHSVREKEVPK